MAPNYRSYLEGLHRAGLHVSNLDDALSFYRDDLAMQLEFELGRPGLRVSMLKCGSARFELLEMRPPAEDDRRALGLRPVAVEVTNVDRAYANLRDGQHPRSSPQPAAG